MRFVRIAVVEEINSVDLTLSPSAHRGDFNSSLLQAVCVLGPGPALRRGFEIARGRIERQSLDERDHPEDEAKPAHDGQSHAVAHTPSFQGVEISAGAWWRTSAPGCLAGQPYAPSQDARPIATNIPPSSGAIAARRRATQKSSSDGLNPDMEIKGKDTAVGRSARKRIEVVAMRVVVARGIPQDHLGERLPTQPRPAIVGEQLLFRERLERRQQPSERLGERPPRGLRWIV